LRPKLRCSLWFCAACNLWASLAVGCGYRPVYSLPASQRLSVQLGQILIAEPLAAQSAASGARAELAAAGLLGRDLEFPRLVIDVLRVDELSRAIHVEAGHPVAGGMSIALVIRARVFAADSQEPTLDTGDLRRAVQEAGDSDPHVDSAAYDVALRSAGERAGRAAARSALGIPEPADEAP
jgi:hypothetical protein